MRSNPTQYEQLLALQESAGETDPADTQPLSEEPRDEMYEDFGRDDWKLEPFA